MDQSDYYMERTSKFVNKNDDYNLICDAAVELEAVRKRQQFDEVLFPYSCRRLLMSIEGNSFCIDCGRRDPKWASVTYGTLLCMSCAGCHRSYGVQTSFVRSIDMDTWNHSQILAMLEGGNSQLQGFFERHKMSSSSCPIRYHTKAAKFYRENLRKHIQGVVLKGKYQGRAANRSAHCNKSASSNNINTVPKHTTRSDASSITTTSTTDEEFSDSSLHSSCTSVDGELRSIPYQS